VAGGEDAGQRGEGTRGGGAAQGRLSPHHQCQPAHVDAVSGAAESGSGGGAGHDRLPRGGYGYTVIDKEGTEIAAWLNSAGISALVLKYRTPNNRAGALQDAQRALSLARERAAEWNVDPQRLGIIGFSAFLRCSWA
jgi:hypothetical protein